MAKQKDKQDKELKRVNIHIDPELHRAFKTAASSQGVNMTDLLLQFIEDYVKKHLPDALKKGRR